jgi:hypothetical protein
MLMLYGIETDQSFSLTDLLQEFERLELKALGQVKRGDVPQGGRTRCTGGSGSAIRPLARPVS